LLGLGVHDRAGRLVRPRLFDHVLRDVGGAAIPSSFSPANNDRCKGLSASSVNADVCDDR
jgi:hypothetical protein